MIWIISTLLLLPYIEGQSSIGNRCSFTQQCGPGAFCYENVCRKDGCTLSSHCQIGELCQYGMVNGQRRPACFPASIDKETTEEYCPGGGAVVVGFDGKLTTCDLLKACSNGHVCNPQFGICCTKLRTCPRPSKTMLNAVTGQPIMCQIKFGRVMPCPGEGSCETKTGFCCIKGPQTNTSTAVSSRPYRGQTCSTQVGCDGGAACICSNSRVCRCECSTELGYTISSDGRSCVRQRRRLKEKCKTDMECSAAFSECSTGGCRCKTGFQRDGDGGCKPISYRCPAGLPLTKKEEVVKCSLSKKLMTSFKSLKTASKTKNETTEESAAINSTFSDYVADDCPQGNYCVPTFDDSANPGFYQGFCCPSPNDIRPICPVGIAHETSFYPDYGCAECPNDYYCHQDRMATKKSICCPKPCVSLEDVFHDGQCYPIAYYGDSCQISAQCSFFKASTNPLADISNLECSSGICTCPAGYSHSEGSCQRVMCTVGLRGEPSVDRNNQLIRCSSSSDCSQGHMCDPNGKVCCRGTNRCPKQFVETGELCTDTGSCKNPGEMCYWPKTGKVKVCCTHDESSN
ncbi:unnamed protein product [Auanema sp. JU1783]|nr:unnamed protein product [Auanema sp. JU1783]